MTQRKLLKRFFLPPLFFLKILNIRKSARILTLFVAWELDSSKLHVKKLVTTKIAL